MELNLSPSRATRVTRKERRKLSDRDCSTERNSKVVRQYYSIKISHLSYYSLFPSIIFPEHQERQSVSLSKVVCVRV